MNFRDALRPRVEFRLRPTQDLRAPRDAFRFKRALEQRAPLATSLPPLGRGPLEADLGAPHPTPCSCAQCLNWWTQQDQDQNFINAACAAGEQR